MLSVATANNRAELIATVRSHGQRYKVALLDIQLDANPHNYTLTSPYTAAGQGM